MAPQQQNKIMNIIQTVLLTVCTSILIWMGMEIQGFKSYMAKTEQVDLTQDRDLLYSAGKIKANEDKNQEQDNKITFLEAMLPDRVKKNH